MPKVLFLVAHLHKGGMQRAISNITQALPPLIESHLAYFGTEHPDYAFGAVHHDLRLPGRAGDSLGRKAVNALRRIRALRRLVREQAIDAVVSFGEIANAYNLLTPHPARRIASIRVDLDAQLAEFGRAGMLVDALMRRLYRRAQAVVCVSRALAEVMRQRVPGAAVETISNLYPVDAIERRGREPLPPSLAFLATRRFVLGVGSLVGQKGFDQLLRAFARLDDAPDLLLVILGSGPQRSALLELADSLGVTQRTVFVEHDDNPARFMSRAALFVLSSRFEGFPNVLVEAMACSAPVVAFDCPTGPAEILGEGRWGRLVADGDESALTRAMQELLRDDDARNQMKALARQRAEQFRGDIVVGHWTALLCAPSRR